MKTIALRIWTLIYLDSDGNAMHYNSSAVINGYTAGGEGKYKYRMFVDGDTAFCIQPGVPLHTGDTLREASSNTWNALSDAQQRAVGPALLYGYQGNRENLPGSDDEKWLAIQTMVWEFVTGCRNAMSPYTQVSTIAYSLHFGSNYPNSGAREVYNQIVSMLTEHNTIPSFMSGSTGGATEELKYSDGKYTLTLTDSNSVLSNYSFSTSNPSAGYKRPAPVEVELVVDETLTVNVHNDKVTVDVPKTSDESHLGLWLALIGVSMAGAGQPFTLAARNVAGSSWPQEKVGTKKKLPGDIWFPGSLFLRRFNMKSNWKKYGSQRRVVGIFADLPAFSFIRDGGDIDEETKQKEEKGVQTGSMRCPYCGSPVIYRKETAPPSTVKGIQAIQLMSEGYTSREIGELMNASAKLVCASILIWKRETSLFSVMTEGWWSSASRLLEASMWSEAESSCLSQRAVTMCWRIIRETYWIPGTGRSRL